MRLERRALLLAGVAVASVAALPAIESGEAAETAEPLPPSVGLVGWLRFEPEGSATFRLALLEQGAAREIASESFAPMPVMTAARRAADAATRIAARSWGVRAGDCAHEPGAIVHSASGRRIRLAIWTDFA